MSNESERHLSRATIVAIIAGIAVIALILSQVVQVKEEGWVTDIDPERLSVFTFDKQGNPVLDYSGTDTYRIEIDGKWWVDVNPAQWGNTTTQHWCEISKPLLGSWRLVGCEK